MGMAGKGKSLRRSTMENYGSTHGYSTAAVSSEAAASFNAITGNPPEGESSGLTPVSSEGVIEKYAITGKTTKLTTTVEQVLDSDEDDEEIISNVELITKSNAIENGLTCLVCNKQFRNRSNMMKHYRIKHKERLDSSFETRTRKAREIRNNSRVNDVPPPDNDPQFLVSKSFAISNFELGTNRIACMLCPVTLCNTSNTVKHYRKFHANWIGPSFSRRVERDLNQLVEYLTELDDENNTDENEIEVNILSKEKVLRNKDKDRIKNVCLICQSKMIGNSNTFRHYRTKHPENIDFNIPLSESSKQRISLKTATKYGLERKRRVVTTIFKQLGTNHKHFRNGGHTCCDRKPKGMPRNARGHNFDRLDLIEADKKGARHRALLNWDLKMNGEYIRPLNVKPIPENFIQFKYSPYVEGNYALIQDFNENPTEMCDQHREIQEISSYHEEANVDVIQTKNRTSMVGDSNSEILKELEEKKARISQKLKRFNPPLLAKPDTNVLTRRYMKKCMEELRPELEIRRPTMPLSNIEDVDLDGNHEEWAEYLLRTGNYLCEGTGVKCIRTLK
jgi:hypothetical protein